MSTCNCDACMHNSLSSPGIFSLKVKVATPDLINYQWRWENCFPARAITWPVCDQTDVRQTSFPVPFLTPEFLPCLPLARQKTLVNPILRPLNPKPQTPQGADQHKSLSSSPKSLKPAAPPHPPVSWCFAYGQEEPWTAKHSGKV